MHLYRQLRLRKTVKSSLVPFSPGRWADTKLQSNYFKSWTLPLFAQWRHLPDSQVQAMKKFLFNRVLQKPSFPDQILIRTQAHWTSVFLLKQLGQT
jgi:hypothetical protein